MKRMLINASQPEEVRVALVDGQKLYDLDIENVGREQKKASIYKARITRVEPSLEAAFIDYGADRHGFLPLKDISREYFQKKPANSSRLVIQELVKEGQEIIVQVDKEERGTKGAALTTFISLAGRYMVLMPNNPRAGGISRRIEGEDRDQLREAMSKLEIPQGMGVIIRTAGIGRSAEELQWDLNYLLQVWEAVSRAGESEKAPRLLYQENSVILRAIRDNLRKDIGEVLIDGAEAFQEARAFIDQVMPNYAERVKFYEDPIPLFSRYQIESQIESAFQHTVKLPSGGSIVIDPTEALVSIDINSARATKGSDIEETALNTNLEAADEIARQLRLRDVGGLLVIDFIDMSSVKNQRAVENQMRDALEPDRARIQTGRISRFGLMEMSRQRLRPSLEELTTEVCPRCTGQGRIRDTRSLALAILRLLEEECLKEHSSSVRAMVPLNIASFLLNEKRQDVAEIEKRTNTHVVIVPDVNMETPQFEVIRLREDHVQEEGEVPSYELAETALAPVEAVAAPKQIAPTETASVKAIQHNTPAPVSQPAAAAVAAPAKEAAAPAKDRSPGLVARLFKSLFSEGEGTESAQAPQSREQRDNSQPRERSQNRTRPQGEGSKRNARPDGSSNNDNRRTEGRKNNRQGEDGERDSNRREQSRNRPPRDQDKNRNRSRNESTSEPNQNREDGGQGRRRRERNPRPDHNGVDEAKTVQNEPAEREAKRQEPSKPMPTAEERSPSAEVLANSKRRPKRNRAELDREAEKAKNPVAPAVSKPEAAQAKIATTSDAAAAATPASADKESTAETVASTSQPETDKGPAARAANDPRARARQKRAAPAPASEDSAKVTESAAPEAPAETTAPVPVVEPASASATAPSAAPATETKAELTTSADAEVDTPNSPAADVDTDKVPTTGTAAATLASSEPKPAETESAETVTVTTGSEDQASAHPEATETDEVSGASKRAYNDPREIKRRAREAELQAQGILPK
jgi:ribonuclease E